VTRSEEPAGRARRYRLHPGSDVNTSPDAVPSLFSDLEAGYVRAGSSGARTYELCCTVGGRRTRIRVIGNDLGEQILRPFSHLELPSGVSDDKADLTIDLWDANIIDNAGQRVGTTPSQAWFQQVSASDDGRFLAHHLPNTLSCLDRVQNRILGMIAWHPEIFIYERGKPLTLPLLQWLGDHDLPVIHAGLVARAGRGALLVGRSGAGKTTLSLRCLRSGFDFVGEDYVALEALPEGGRILGHSLYASAFLQTEHLPGLGIPGTCIHTGRQPDEHKSLAMLDRSFSEQLRSAVGIEAMALTRIVDTTGTRISPVRKGEALLELAKGSLLQIPNVGMRSFKVLAELVEHVPCYRLEYGLALDAGPAGVDEILSAAAEKST